MGEELRGWKSIGEHFGTSARTAQRWERDHAMPVHRTGRTRGASVFAFPDELDAWRKSPAGQRADSESPDAAGAPATWTTSVARRVRSRPAAVGVTVVAILLVAVAVGLVLHSRKAASAATRPHAPSEAYAVPNSSFVFLLTVTAADGTPFTFHVFDGGMATLAVRGGPKLGFMPSRHGAAARLSITAIKALPPSGGESIRVLTSGPLLPHTPVHFQHGNVSVDIEWTDSLEASDLTIAPDDPPRKCCIACDNVTACAAQVAAPCGTCCADGRCVGGK